MHEQDDGPSDPGKVAATITAALAGGMIELPGFASASGPKTQPVTLFREIDALGGAATTTFDAPYVRAISDVLQILERRGFSAEADAITREQFDVVEVAQLLDRLGAYIVGQDTRLIAAGEALAEANRMVDTAQANTTEAIRLAQEAQSERDASVVDRDKADAAHGRAERDHRAILKGLRAGFDQFKAEQRAEVEGLKGDVRIAETQWDEEREKRERAEAAHAATVASLDWVQEAFESDEVGLVGWGSTRGEVAQLWVQKLKAQIDGLKSDVRAAEEAANEERSMREQAQKLFHRECTRTAELGMRIEGAIFALRHGMNEGVEVSQARFSPSTSLIDYLAAPLGDKPRCRVVTSPRFYSYEQYNAAIRALWDSANAPTYGERVRRVAEALGMRRAAQ